MRKTKIVCTLGPKTDEPKVLEELARAGMNVARLNFSHSDFDEHKRRIAEVKALRKRLGLPIGIMLDTKGPEIRIGKFKSNGVHIDRGAEFILTVTPCEGDCKKVFVSYPLQKVLHKGDEILIDDGLMEFTVERTDAENTYCTAVSSGELKNNKSINLPNIELDMPYMTLRDKMDLEFGVREGVDFVAASFVRCAEDVTAVRETLDGAGGEDIEIISKIENMSGVEKIDEIIDVSDGIMVARGDMGVEIPIELLPSIQKCIIKKCLEKGKKCVTATQMLDSMIKNPRPTRAEVTDIANAILDGTGAIMLSGETAIGKYGVESVKVMDQVARKIEPEIKPCLEVGHSVSDVIAGGASVAAMNLQAESILCVTHSGHTASMVARYRPPCPIAAVTTDERKYYTMSLVWGVSPYLGQKEPNSTLRFDKAVEIARREGFLKKNGKMIVTGGERRGTTNVMKVISG